MTLGDDFGASQNFKFVEKSWFVVGGGGLGCHFGLGWAHPPVHCTIVILLNCHLKLGASPREVMYNIKYRLL